MSSPTKVEQNIVPKVVKGESFLAELGVTRFQWTIKNFKGFLGSYQMIKSPRFSIDIINPSTSSKKVQSFHLDMVLPNKNPGTQCPVFLIQETDEKVLTKTTLESFGPKNAGSYYCTPYVQVSLEAANVFEMSANDRKKVMTIALPNSVGCFPDELTIEVQVALSQPAEKIVY
jgi:hypothetical protein